MFCTKCGNSLKDTQRFCPVCGKPANTGVPPVPQKVPPPLPYQSGAPPPGYRAPWQQPSLQQVNITIPPPQGVPVTKWATPRIVIGIITIALFFLFQVQSCLAIPGEALQSLFSETSGTAGTTGYVISFFFLAGGIVSIVCRKSKGGSIAAGALYFFCFLGTVQEDFSYFGDLEFYCFLSFVFAVILILGGILQKKAALPYMADNKY